VRNEYGNLVTLGGNLANGLRDFFFVRNQVRK
jgi:hypothetical protein